MEYIDLNLRGPQAGESGAYQNRGKTEWKFNGASGSSTGFQRSTPERSPPEPAPWREQGAARVHGEKAVAGTGVRSFKRAGPGRWNPSPFPLCGSSFVLFVGDFIA